MIISEYNSIAIMVIRGIINHIAHFTMLWIVLKSLFDYGLTFLYQLCLIIWYNFPFLLSSLEIMNQGWMQDYWRGGDEIVWKCAMCMHVQNFDRVHWCLHHVPRLRSHSNVDEWEQNELKQA